ncbi:MAG: DUF2220 domain-containing protein [Bacilli bacterium]|nr:DUF2220 domain-containing protein [Bacilli bacterium]
MEIETAVLIALLKNYLSRESSYAPDKKSKSVFLERRNPIFTPLRNKPELEEKMQSLERTGFVEVEYVNGIFYKVTLKKDDDNLKGLFEYLKMEDPRKAMAEQRELLGHWTENSHPVVANFASAMLEKITGRKPAVKNYFTSTEQLSKILKALEAIEALETETFCRDLSMRLFGNSKELEGMAPKLNSLYREFDELDYDEDDDPLLMHGLIKNPVDVRIKGPICIKVGNQEIDLEKWPGFFSLNNEAIKKCAVIGGKPKRVVTIENLTSFTTFEDKEAVVIYLAGFHDGVKQSLIRKIYEAFPNVPYCHFGDMDSGGFHIFHRLKIDTRIPFIPLNMDVKAFEKVKGFALPLSDNDRKRLERQKDDPEFLEFHELIERMLKEGKKVEQEAFIALDEK